MQALDQLSVDRRLPHYELPAAHRTLLNRLRFHASTCRVSAHLEERLIYHFRFAASRSRAV